MLRCWELEPKDRSTFSDLVSSLSQSLEAMASYMDVGAFGKLQMESKSAGNSARLSQSRLKIITLLRKKAKLILALLQCSLMRHNIHVTLYKYSVHCIR